MLRLGVAALLFVAAGAFAWIASDRVEQRNDFCTACHLPSGTPLHQQLRRDFDRIIPVSLAGVHGRGWVETREDSAFRCIDCHAGAGPVERTKVKLIAARDGLRYLAGSFEEPDHMPFELSRPACLRCHPGFRGSAAPGFTLEAFHGVAEHDGAKAPACVACHAVHETDGSGIVYFMEAGRVDRQCRACHPERGVAPAATAVIPSGPAGR